jgi:hypothetical protein
MKVFFLCLGIIAGGCAAGKKPAMKPLPAMTPEEQRELVQYLKDHWQTPEDYVVSKFKDHDIVIIGEYHRIRHDVELIHSLIPRLYRAGVYDLGIEFGCVEFQASADSLVAAERYDENKARWLMFKNFMAWGYREYHDIYRKAWDLNRTLPPDAPKFRIVHLGYRQGWNELKGKPTPEVMKKVWHKGDGDIFMANVILSEFVKKKRKALVYSGLHHAFTRYKQPVYDNRMKFIRFGGNRMGNVVYKEIPDRVFMISLHQPWAMNQKFVENERPVRGVIDEVMGTFGDKRVGFDVVGSPFGDLPDDDTYYSAGYKPFTLGVFCDGYIYQKPFTDYEGCSVDPQFITNENFREAVDNCPNPEARKFYTSPEQIISSMRRDADIKRRFRDLK